MTLSKDRLKYPVGLFFLLLALKLFYIVIESFYNYDVLSITTNAQLIQEEIEALNIKGHQISSLGITLLLIPFFYLIVKRFRSIVIYLSVFAFAILSYIGIYHSLNIIVEKVVQANSDKRHNAYYLNLFKYGILNNIFSYNSFINSSETASNTLSIDSKILLTNTFLALYADDALIEKLKERGKERVADIYLQKEGKEEYEKEYENFKKTSEHIIKGWDEFNEARAKVKNSLDALQNEQEIKNAYQKFQNQLIEKYTLYKNAYKEAYKRVEQETSLEKLSEIKPKLEKFFKYRSYQKAQTQYKETMLKSFGVYIEPDKWLDKNGNVSFNSITETIKEQIFKSVREKAGVKEGLSAKEFFYADAVKIKVAQELKKHDILIPYDFDYSYEQFKKYYVVMASKKSKEIYDAFYTSLEKQIGKNDLSLAMEWKDFIYSSYVKEQIQNKSHIADKAMIKTLQDIYFERDLGKFKELIYTPKVMEKVQKYMYTQEEFKNNQEVAKIGDDAIKLLYIPPMALSLSIVALLLNIVTVIGMLLVLINLKPKVLITIAKLALFFGIVATPFLSQNGKINNEMLNNSMTVEMKPYITFLGWISYWEKFNVKLHER